MPEDVKLLPGQLLGIQQTVRESRPPPLPHRPPLPSFECPTSQAQSVESPYACIDEFNSESDDEAAAIEEQPAEAEAVAAVDPGR